MTADFEEEEGGKCVVQEERETGKSYSQPLAAYGAFHSPALDWQDMNSGTRRVGVKRLQLLFYREGTVQSSKFLSASFGRCYQMGARRER